MLNFQFIVEPLQIISRKLGIVVTNYDIRDYISRHDSGLKEFYYLNPRSILHCVKGQVTHILFNSVGGCPILRVYLLQELNFTTMYIASWLIMGQ